MADGKRAKRQKKKELLAKVVDTLVAYGARKVSVFGSYARGEEKLKSDIDVLVEFPETKSLLEFVRIEQELSERAGVKVDLLTEKCISPYLINRIKKEAKVLYG